MRIEYETSDYDECCCALAPVANGRRKMSWETVVDHHRRRVRGGEGADEQLLRGEEGADC